MSNKFSVAAILNNSESVDIMTKCSQNTDALVSVTQPKFPTETTTHGFSSPENSSAVVMHTLKKKQRNLFTKTQTSILRAYFNKKNYISAAEREALSITTSLSPEQIKIWFQNNRYKMKNSFQYHRNLQKLGGVGSNVAGSMITSSSSFKNYLASSPASQYFSSLKSSLLLGRFLRNPNTITSTITTTNNNNVTSNDSSSGVHTFPWFNSFNAGKFSHNYDSKVASSHEDGTNQFLTAPASSSSSTMTATSSLLQQPTITATSSTSPSSSSSTISISSLEKSLNRFYGLQNWL